MAADLDRNRWPFPRTSGMHADDAEWIDFLYSLNANAPGKAAYSKSSHSFAEDRAACKLQAKRGEARALEMQEKFALWKLTK